MVGRRGHIVSVSMHSYTNPESAPYTISPEACKGYREKLKKLYGIAPSAAGSVVDSSVTRY